LPFHPGYILLAIALGLFTYAFLHKMQQVERLRAQETALQAQNQATARENARLERAIRYFRTDQFIQSAARSELGYTLPGEQSIISVPAHSPPPPPRLVARRPAATPEPSWKQWWHSFFP
jgi:cell division protein FtsB